MFSKNLLVRLLPNLHLYIKVLQIVKSNSKIAVVF